MPVLAPDGGVQTQANVALDLTAKKAGDLALAKIDLFTNNLSPTPQSVLGDFTLPTFTGYAQKAVTAWTANEEAADGTVSTVATNVVTWVGPNDGTGQVVFGYILRAAAGGDLIAAVKFPVAVNLGVPTDVLDLVASFRVPQ